MKARGILRILALIYFLFSPARHSSCCRVAQPERNEKRTGNAENNRESRGNYKRTGDILVLRLAAAPRVDKMSIEGSTFHFS